MASNKIKKTDVAEKDVFSDVEKSAKDTIVVLEEMTKVFKENLKLQKQFSTGLKSNRVSDLKKLSTAQKEVKKNLTGLNAVDKERIRLEKRLSDSRTKQSQANEVIKQQLIFERREKAKLAKETLGLSNAFTRLTDKTNKAQITFKRLAAEFGINSVQAKNAKVSFDKLDRELRQINKSAKDGRRDVGRYSLALRGVGTSLKTILLGGGVVGVILSIGRAFKNAFDRVREFDKEMANVAGISGLTRKELSSTEEVIKNVAGSSTKTSNEVAKLATTLFSLGKSRAEVNKLLKPTNDLSIALGATSDEAGELLVSTLNAFGKGADSGQKFADVIAKMRTSTSLDFQRIKDSLGFVSSTANVLNISIGETGAMLGVLVDNGKKAASSGRLLNSSFIKLAKEGKTLEGALDRINKAQEKGAKGSELLRIAAKDFGGESASLGIILANNRDRVAELANEFDNLSEGALKELTDEQLKSMDAQLKILDSTFEKFLINIENGEGVLSDMFKGVISGAVNAINTIDKVSVSLSKLKNGAIGAREDLVRAFAQFAGPAGEILEGQFSKIDELIEKETDRIAENFTKKDRKTQETISRNLSKRIKKDLEALKGADVLRSVGLERRIKRNQLLLSKLEIVNDEVKKGSKDLDENTESTNRNVAAKRELTGLIEKQSKILSDLNKEIRRATTEDRILELSIEFDVEKEELDRLKRIVSSSLKEIQKIELDLIEDTTDKRIAKEKEKSDKIIKQIETNSRIEGDKRNELIVAETERLEDFELNAELERQKRRIKQEADFSKAEFEQRRSGFKSEEEFEKEKGKQFIAIKRKQLEAELSLLEFAGRKEDELRIEKLKADIESLFEFKKNSSERSDVLEKTIAVAEEIITNSFQKRNEQADKEISDQEKRERQLQDLANSGQQDAKDSLAQNQKDQAEAVKKKEELAQKEKQFQLALAVIKAFNAELDVPGTTTGEALAKALVSTTVLTAAASTLPAFYDGTEDTGSGGGIDNKGGFKAILHPHERVVPEVINDKLNGISNVDLGKAADSGLLAFALNSNNTGVDFGNTSKINNEYQKMIDSNKEILKAIKEQPIYMGSDFDNMRGLAKHIVRSGNSTVETTFKL